MRTYRRLPAAGLGCFVSAWVLTRVAGITDHDEANRPLADVTSRPRHRDRRGHG